MGATTDQIKANLVALGFDNPSATALYNKIAQALGITVDNTIQELTNNENLITATISSKNYGKAGYYVAKALAFQYGDNLVTDPTTLDLIYAVINPSNQIVKQAAFEELVNGNNVQLFMKVAGVDGPTGNLLPLTTPQLSAFTSYFSNFQLPGLPISVVSLPANILAFNGTLTYLKTYDLTGLQTALVAALTAFRQSFVFDGVFYAGDLEDYIKANVPGVRDFFLYNSVLDATAFQGSISLPAGYFNYSDAINSNIATAFTYNPVAA